MDVLRAVRRLIVERAIAGVSSFNQARVADEQLKLELSSKAPHLDRAPFHLEDHPLLRGSLAVFELDAATFERRARAFHELFADATVLPALTGALLAAGDYSRRANHRFSKLGSGSNMTQWREEILTGARRAHPAGVRDALGRILDVVADREGDVRSALETFTKAWLDEVDPASGLDWRWYFVRNPEMRAGRSGVYASATGSLGYRLCILDKKTMNSYYQDPVPRVTVGERQLDTEDRALASRTGAPSSASPASSASSSSVATPARSAPADHASKTSAWVYRSFATLRWSRRASSEREPCSPRSSPRWSRAR